VLLSADAVAGQRPQHAGGAWAAWRARRGLGGAPLPARWRPAGRWAWGRLKSRGRRGGDARQRRPARGARSSARWDVRGCGTEKVRPTAWRRGGVRRALRQVESIGRRRYRYLAVPKDERERPHLVRELVKCGKSTCGCARDPRRRHGPYIYFRWERCDAASGRVVYYREYVPPSEVVRVRRWIRRHRGEAAQSRGVLTWL